MEIDIYSLMDVSDIPGVQPLELEPIQLPQVVSNPSDRSVDLSDDYCSVRQALKQQQALLMEAAMISLDNARSSDSPRSMEVFSTLMGQFTVSNKELLKIHKDMKDITEESTKADAPVAAQKVETQNIFVGTPAELMGVVGSQYDSIKKQEREARIIDAKVMDHE